MEADDGWRALQARLDLFHAVARKLATALDYTYPAALEQNISACIREIKGTRLDTPDFMTEF